MPGFINYFYKDGLPPTHTKPFFTDYNILTVHNIILKNILIFFNNIMHFADTLPPSIIQLIPEDSPIIKPVSDYHSDWYAKYNSIPFNSTVFFKGPLLYTDIISTLISESEGYIPGASKASFKTRIKAFLLTLQEAGDKYEWEGENFKLMAITGLRKSERLKLKA